MQLNSSQTALVLIDLQQGIVSMPLAPHTSEKVVEKAKEIASKFRASSAPVICVHVGWSKDNGDRLAQKVDQPPNFPSQMPPNWSEYVDGLVHEGDIKIMKHQWGAFHGTDLDLQLRRRAIRTIVLGGIATNFGVESTARAAWELGYEVVIVEDMCSAVSDELHQFPFKHVFPRIAVTIKAADLNFTASRAS